MKSRSPRSSTKPAPRDERLPVAFPISVGSSTGVVKDISSTGIYFEIDQNQEVGSKIEFVLDLATPGGPIQIQCQGTVVRIEEKSGRIGIAATINESLFKNQTTPLS